MADDSKDSLLNNEDGSSKAKPTLYATRYWMVACFSMFTLLQGGMWAIPGPISGAYNKLYSVSNNEIQLLINWGPIVYIPLALPQALWMDKPGGMRGAVLFCHLLITAGAVLRVLAGLGFSDGVDLALLHISYVLNAAAGPVSMAAVGKISELWFPVESRGTATAVMTEFNILGGALAFLVGPAMVRDNTMGELQNLNWLCLALCIVTLVAILGHFPSAPPTPPSRSAAELRDKEEQEGFSLGAFKAALRQLARNRDFIVLSCAYGFATGMFASWTAMMSINLSSYSASTAGYLSFASTIAGNVGGVLLGRAMDKFRRLKSMLVGLMALAAVGFTGFAIVCAAMPANTSATLVMLFLTGAQGGFALISTVPLFFELSLEVSHPAPEATVVTVLTMVNNVGSIIFLTVPVDSAGTAWMNWLFAGTVLAFTVALALSFNEKSMRYDMDVGRHLKRLHDEASHMDTGGRVKQLEHLRDLHVEDGEPGGVVGHMHGHEL